MGVETGYIHEVTAEMFDKDISVNLKGAFLFTKYALPEMMKNEKGSIVNFSTASTIRGLVGHSIYVSAKAGIESLTRILATQYGRKGIRANSVVLFFASDDSAYVNGQVLTMDGGLTCHYPQWKEDLEMESSGGEILR